MEIYTIGFVKKSAEQFFQLLKENHIECVVDIRLRPCGQLTGFTKKDDLNYFLKHLIGSEYLHLPILAPTTEILDAYRKDRNWHTYVIAFKQLMHDRDIPNSIDRTIFESKRCCLLCSESEPTYCHRSLVSEMLAKNWGALISHL